MATCSSCGRHLIRTHRTRVQKLLFSDAFKCGKCGRRSYNLHPSLHVKSLFLFSRYTRCIACGNLDVHRLEKRDRIDSVSKRLVSRLMQLLGAPINRCAACRLQYYDWRSIDPDVHSPEAEPEQL